MTLTIKDKLKGEIMADTKQMLLDNVLAVVAELQDGTQNAYDWINDQLCVEGYSISADGTYKGAEITCAYGGPTVWVDTKNDTVYGVWGGDSIERKYTDNINLDDTMAELHSCIA